jgi:hypothetical protein
MYAAVAALSIGLVLVFGKTVSWDVLHYHLYAAFSLVDDRFGKDLLAAGPQSYINPLPMAPLALMEWLEVPVKVSASILACIHSLNILLCLEVAAALGLWPRGQQPSRWPLFFVLVLAILSPLYLSLVGTTYSDIVSSIPVLAAMALALRGMGAQSAGPVSFRLWGVVGGLMGLGAALKLSSAVYAVALAMTVLLFSGRHWWMPLWRYVLGAFVGFLVCGGFWMFKLWQTFGNPLFPMFPSVLGDAGMGLVLPSMARRFIPGSLEEALVYPFRIALPGRAIYVESELPDLRYALLAVLMGLALVWGAVRLWRRRAAIADGHHELPGPLYRRPLCFTLTFFAISWVMWMLTSGNGRYMMPLAMLVSPLIVGVWLWVARESNRLFVYPLLVVCAAQVMQLVMGSVIRIDTQPFWTRRWIEVDVPAGLKSSPALYLSPHIQSLGSIIPSFHPDSGFINVGGQVPLDRQSIQAPYAQSLFARYQGRVKVLIPETGEESDVSIYERTNFALAPLDWAVAEPRQCDVVVVKAMREPDVVAYAQTLIQEQIRSGQQSGKAMVDPSSASFRVLACDAAPRPGVGQAQAAKMAQVDAALSKVEAACPNFFHPAPGVTQRIGRDMWIRFYGTTDFNLVSLNGLVQYIDSVLGGKPVTVGRVEDIAEGRFKMDCTKRREHVEVDFSMMPKSSRSIF